MIWSLVVYSFLTLFSYGLADNIRGPLYPELLQFFQLNSRMGSWFFAAASLVSFFGSLLSTKIFYYFPAQRALALAILIMGFALIGCSNSLNFTEILSYTAVFGFGMGIVSVSQNTLVAIGSPTKYRNQVLSGLHSMYGFSSLLAPLFVNLIYAHGMSWRECFFYCGIVMLLVGGAGLIYFHNQIFKNVNYQKSTPNLGESVLPKLETSKWHIGRNWIQKNRSKFIFASVTSFYVIAEILFSSRLALYLRQAEGFDLTSANLYVGLFFLFLLGGRVIFMLVHRDLNLRFQLYISLGFTFCFAVLGLTINPLFLCLCGLSMAVFYPLAMSYLAFCFPHEVSLVISYCMAAQSVSLFLMHLLAGELTDLLGIHRTMLLGPLFIIVAAIGLFLFRPKLFAEKHLRS